MAWVESHTVLIRHRKLRELATDLRLRPSYVMGHLHALWHAALEQQENGDLAAWSDQFIAESSDFPGDAPQWVRLLQTHGWLDGKLIHDWLDIVGRYLIKKYSTSNRERLIEIWKRHGRVYGSDQSETGKRPDSDSTGDDSTEEKRKKAKDSAPLNGAGRPSIPPKPPKDPAKKPERAPIHDWQKMIDHIGAKWTEKKRKKTGNTIPFPWPENRGPGANVWSELRNQAGRFRAFGIMALWDMFLELDDNWTSGTGHSLGAFFHKLPVLVDDPRWKSLSTKYENQLCQPIGETLGKVLAGIVPGGNQP